MEWDLDRKKGHMERDFVRERKHGVEFCKRGPN